MSATVPPLAATALADPPVATPPAAASSSTASSAPSASRVRRWWRGREEDAAWVRPGLVGLLALTAVLYLWGLGASGWANSYYAAAAQAASQSWKALLFGSLDASNFITVDKTPASIWVMGLSARLFGVNSWSILVPQALEGVATVGVVYLAVRRWFRPEAALLAGAVTALTPVAALMFRFDNPDALLVLLLTVGAYAMTRAIEDGRTRWLVLAGSAVGFAFLAKELQAFVVLPAFGVAYLIAGPHTIGRRIRQGVAMAAVLVVSAGWWIAVVQLTPASARPYIGGSQDNSFWDVLLGYNGFGRLTGDETGSVGGAPTGSGRWGATGLTRLFNDQFGGQSAWLIPAALVFLVAGLVLAARRPRTDHSRAALVLWGGWLVLTGLMISLSKGIIHEYYTVALAPAIGALVGIGAATWWPRRGTPAGRGVLALAVGATTVTAVVLLGRTPDWNPWLRPVVIVGGLVVVACLVAAPARAGAGSTILALGAVAVALLGPAAYSVATAATANAGAIPLAGPATTGGFGGGPGGGSAQFGGGQGPPGGFAGGAGGPGGGLLNGTTVDDELAALLTDGADGFRWAAATSGANNAASYQLETGEPVMALGGFNGSDPAPTLTEFQQMVADGEVHYYLAGGGRFGGGFGGGGFGGGGPGGFGAGGATGGSNATSEIATWVAETFAARTVGGVTVYDLSTSIGT